MDNIKKVSFDIEVITPLFLSGANQNAVELRPQSIRGLLRYWYRALLGGMGVIDIKELRELESKLWGNEEKGSAVAVRVKNTNLVGGGGKENITLGLGGSRPGTTYMFFSTKMNRRPYIDVGTIFTIELSSYQKDAEKWLDLASYSLWCWINLGGLGTRSRRGGGGLMAEKINGNAFSEELRPKNFNTPQELKQYLENGFKKIRSTLITSIVQGNNGNDVPEQPQFHILNERVAKIWITSESWGRWEDAIENIGIKFRDARINIRARQNRRVLGLPLRGYRDGRRGSPLFIKVAKLSNNKYVGVFTYFKSEFFPSDPQPPDTVVNDFINSFSSPLSVRTYEESL